jgi:hypothetical protein
MGEQQRSKRAHAAAVANGAASLSLPVPHRLRRKPGKQRSGGAGSQRSRRPAAAAARHRSVCRGAAAVEPPVPSADPYCPLDQP